MNRGAAALMVVLVLAAFVSVPALDALRLLPPTTNDAGYILTWVGLIAVALLGSQGIRSMVRKDAYASAAKALGLTSTGGTDQFWRYPLPLFEWGLERSIANMMIGSHDGQDVILLDYSCKLGAGRGSSTFRYLCALVELPLDCPKTEIAPLSVLGRVADVIGVQRLDFEYQPFSERYRVQTANRKFAVALIDPPMIEWLLTQNPSTHFEIGGAYVMSVGKDVDMQDAKSLAAEGSRLLAGVLDFRGRFSTGALEIARQLHTYS